MRYNYRAGVIAPFTQKFYKQLIVAFAAVFIATMAMMTAITSAAVVTVNGCDFDQVGSTWTLQADCTSTARIDLPAGTTLEGEGHTISSNWVFASNSNNAAIGVVNADGVTINDLTVDGTSSTGLHGILVFVSQNVSLNNVSALNNDKSGVNVNGSTVAVNNITTGGNGWHGVNVDQGSGVTTPAILTVNGVSHHTDTLHIYVDHYSAGVRDVVDTNSQYNVTNNPPFGPSDDRLYTLKTVLGSKDECKKGGWMDSENPVFKNQGDCVSWFATGGRH